ncbi:FAD-dependent oxidoreductase [Streptomyces sp. NPDC091287]|uniref:FAD-dependent oxidoreductase n=1 Tax=Streptomyces sp. NPDC091287 TaxID=3365988 RepID=UPI00380F5EF1
MSRLPERADVVVIGGGVIGTSIACQLAESGVGTVLLERGELGSGSSSNTAGVVRTYFPGNALISSLAVRSLADYRAPEAYACDSVSIVRAYATAAQQAGAIPPPRRFRRDRVKRATAARAHRAAVDRRRLRRGAGWAGAAALRRAPFGLFNHLERKPMVEHTGGEFVREMMRWHFSPETGSRSG